MLKLSKVKKKNTADSRFLDYTHTLMHSLDRPLPSLPDANGQWCSLPLRT